MFIEFIIKVLQTLNQELVERSDLGKTNKQHTEICRRVKEGVREIEFEDHKEYPIVWIVHYLEIVLKNYQSFEPQVVQDTLYVFAQLIDWNELQHFENMVSTCIELLQSTGGQVTQGMKNGAFNSV